MKNSADFEIWILNNDFIILSFLAIVICWPAVLDLEH